MTTPKQTAANKANAQKSTGPKTEAGKAVVAGNAISHGILSSRLFLEDESPDDFQALQDDLRQALIPPMGEEERAMLEQNVLEHGCRDPLVTWRGVLLDGHNRYAICQKHGIEFRTIEMEFDSIEQARVWMRNNQLGVGSLPNYLKKGILRLCR